MSCYLYRHFDKKNRLLYVGVSLNAINRLSQHHDASHWFTEIATVKISVFSDRKEALAAEQQAILYEKPRHNLMRPSVKEVQEANNAADNSRTDLLRRLVQFNPMYSVQGAAEALQIGPTAVKRLIDAGEIGTIQIGTKTRIAGWQIIEFMEAQSKPPTHARSHVQAADTGGRPRPMVERPNGQDSDGTTLFPESTRP